MRNSKKYVNKKELKGEKEMKIWKYWLSLYVRCFGELNQLDESTCCKIKKQIELKEEETTKRERERKKKVSKKKEKIGGICLHHKLKMLVQRIVRAFLRFIDTPLTQC